VVFHSDSRRNRNENLFHETNNSEALKGAVLTRHGLVDVEYRGRPDLAYVTQFGKVEGTPFALVVFADQTYYETVASEIAIVAISLYLIYVVVLAGVVAVLWFFMRPVRLIELIWPQAANAWRYTSTTIVAGIFLVVMSFWCARSELADLWLGALFLGALAAA